MSSRIPEEIIQEIRDRTDIVEVVSRYVTLKRSGANHQGLCPFHSEKTPSFNVNSPRQIFHCFGCGVGGNVFSFLMQIEGVSFPEAVRQLGEKVGVEVPEEQASPAEEKRRQEMERLVRINEVAAEFYHRLLMDSEEGGPARRYLRQRGYDADTVRAFGLGYAPERWEALVTHLQEKGFDLSLVREKTGLIREGKEGRGDYDLFRKRLLFPIHDVRGQVVAFGGRVLDDSLPKYINSPESPIYNKSRILYGLSQAREAIRREGAVIIVEGYFDQMALCRAGMTHAVATCGTALTAEHGKLLKRYAEKVLLLFDQDKAGLAATFRSMEVLLPAGLSVAVVTLGEGEDPDSFLAKRGAEEMAKRLAAAGPVLDYFIDVTLRLHDETAEGKARAIEQILEKFRLLRSDIERDLYLKALAEKTGLDESLLRRKSARPGALREPVPHRRPAPVQSEKPAANGVLVKAQKAILKLFLENPEIREQIMGGELEALFPDPRFRAIGERIREMLAASGAVDTEKLLAGLAADVEAQALLAGVLVETEGAYADEPEKLFEDCCRTVRKQRHAERLKQLPRLISEAEASGDFDSVQKMQKELLELKKKL